MPELPEVETVTKGIQCLIDKPIINVIIRQPRLRYPIDINLPKHLIHNKIIRITRRAKYIIMDLASNKYLIWHLGMSGSLTTVPNGSSHYNQEQSSHNQNILSTIKKHDHVDIIFADITLRYNDPRRFGCLILTDNIVDHPLLINCGPEPLTNNFNAIYLLEKIKDKKSSIKQLLMNNQIVVGVGNIYACEALFNAKISPLRLSSTITMDEVTRLIFCVKDILKIAIQLGGSSLRDYKQADGKLGYFQNIHNVYGKAGGKCNICNNIILEHRLGQRNSFYCPNCQK
jgi:formamidopyrimidine-DNA glycosylase